jgi:hypothetical protein
MPDSQTVFAINTYSFAGYQYPIRLPTPYELGVVKNYLCDLDQPMLHHPWHYSRYDVTLEDTPELWPVIAEGCNPLTGGIVIDHNAVDPAAIPQAWLDQARELVTFFNHKSIGNNILDGIADLETLDPARYSINVQHSSGTSIGINHYEAGTNQHPMDKISGFAALVLDGHNTAFMKFCVGDFEPWTSYAAHDIWIAYRDMMIEQQSAHPDTTLVWWTAPLTTQSDARGLASFAEFNDYVRSYVAANGGILFDIADIESHDPGGNPVTAGGYEAMYNGYSTDGAHLNQTGRQRVASAMWWLLARLAGWGDTTDWISVTAANDEASVFPGETATYALSVTASEGFSDPVTLALQGEPSGATVSFDHNPVTPPSDSQLHVTTTASTAPGIYAMAVTGTSGVLTDTANLTLIVASAAPSFTLSISPTTRIARPNQVVSYTTVVAEANGFSQPVSLTVVGLPTGVDAGWSVNPVTPGNSSILTLSIPSSPSFGNHPLQVVGTADMGTADMQVVAEGFELIITYPFRVYLPIILKRVQCDCP